MSDAYAIGPQGGQGTIQQQNNGGKRYGLQQPPGQNNNRAMISKYKRSSFNQLDGPPVCEAASLTEAKISASLKSGSITVQGN